MRLSSARAGSTPSPVLAAASFLGALLLLPVAATPAQAQWGDGYEQYGNGAYYQPPRRRARDAYYRDDGSYGRQPRYAPQQEAPRQFYWPWEDRPQQSAPRPERAYRVPPRPRAVPAYADTSRAGQAAKRRLRPARAPEPPKPAVVKTEPSVQIAVFGDSLADHLARGLDDVFEDNADVAVIDRAKGDSGLVRKDVVDWPKAADDYLQANPKVRYALVMLGANDRQPLRDSDSVVDPMSPRWRELYRGRVEAMLKVFADRKIPLVWVGLPPMQSETMNRDLATVNEIVHDAATKAGATYVDIWPGFVDERDRYAASGPDAEGQLARLRTADGVHFTKAGDRKLAHFADVELKRLMGIGAPSVPEQPAPSTLPPSAPAATAVSSLDGNAPPATDIAAIDRQITAMLPSLPEPPGVPALPVKAVAGPVVPLGRAETSPGGSLTTGRPRDGDGLGTIERTLVRGNAPMPQPGRADDFRWPPG